MRSHDKELVLRPPVEEWAAAYFKYQRPAFDEEPGDLSAEALAESDLPEFEP